MNTITFTGHVGKVGEIKQVGETKVLKFTVADSVQREYTDRNGKTVEDITNWYNVEAWGHHAAFCEKALSKGKKVAIIGELRLRQYEKDGVKGTSIDIRASNVDVMSPKEDNQQAAKATVTQPTPVVNTPKAASDDDLPF